MLIFYGWTAVVAFGCLSFLAFPWPVATILIVTGLILCSVVTFGPLRKRGRSTSAPTQKDVAL